MTIAPSLLKLGHQQTHRKWSHSKLQFFFRWVRLLNIHFGGNEIVMGVEARSSPSERKCHPNDVKDLEYLD